MREDALTVDWLGGQAPVQAEGTVAGRPFYFRSRYAHWTFSLSEDDEVHPVAIDAAVAGAAHGFFREGAYGTGRFEASYMPEGEARRIIRACAAEYLQERAGA